MKSVIIQTGMFFILGFFCLASVYVNMITKADKKKDIKVYSQVSLPLSLNP